MASTPHVSLPDREGAGRSTGRASDRALELLNEHSTDVLCEVCEGTIVYVSPNAHVSGRDAIGLRGRRLADLVHPDDLSALARCTEPGWVGPIQANFRVRDAVGTWQWREARGAHAREDDGTHRTVLVLRDINDRKQAEDALRKSEARAKALVAAIPDLMFRMTRGGVYLDFKAERDEDLYVAPEGIIGGNIRDLLPPEVSEPALIQIERALDEGGVQTLEYSLPKQGQLCDYEARFTASGKDEVVVISRDVTAQNQAEQALRESEAKYRQIVEEARDVVYAHDLAGNFTEVNPAGLALFGYRADEVHGLDFANVIDPACLLVAIENMQRAFRGEEMVGNVELLTHGKDGTAHWLEVTPAPIRRDDEIVGFRGIARDITERKDAEQRIRLQSQVLDTVRQSIIVTDLAGSIIHINLHTGTMFGYSEDESMGMIALALVAPGSHATARFAMSCVIGGKDWSGELTARRKDGTSFPAFGHAAPLCDTDGTVTGAIIITADISDLKRAQEEATLTKEHAAVLRERARIAEELHDSVAQFFFGIGIASKDLLDRRSPATSTVRRKLGQIQRLAIDGGREVRNSVAGLAPPALAEGFDASIARLASELRAATGIEVDYAREGKEIELSAEMQTEMYHGVQEALYNARKHARASAVSIRLWSEQGEAALIIRDDGVGRARAIEEAVRQRAGFGLPNLRERFDRCGGRVEIVDNDGPGISIACYLPIEVRT